MNVDQIEKKKSTLKNGVLTDEKPKQLDLIAVSLFFLANNITIALFAFLTVALFALMYSHNVERALYANISDLNLYFIIGGIVMALIITYIIALLEYNSYYYQLKKDSFEKKEGLLRQKI